MLCNKCGTENPDGAVFCGGCGARIDGKKECPSCGNFINEQNLFCNYCGARTDGKKVCASCGAVYEENFCPQCGAASVKTPRKQSARGGENVGYKNILDIVKTSVVFASVMLLFIFSFFVGVSVSLRVSGNSGTAGTGTSFYYLITQFKEIAEEISDIKISGQEIFPEFYAGAYVPAVFAALIVGINILVCLAYAIVSVIKFVRRFKDNKPVNMVKYIILPIVTTLASYAAVMALCGVEENGFANARFSLNATSITNIVLVSVLLACAAALQLVIDGRKTIEGGRLLKYITLSLTAVFALVALATAGKTVVTVKGSAEDFGSVNGKIGPLTFFMAIMTTLGVEKEPPKELNTLANYAMATAIVYMIFFVVLCVLLYFILHELTSEKCFPVSMILGSSAFAVSIGYLVVSALLNNKLLGTIGASPIVGLIMCAFVLAGTVLRFVQWLKTNKER